MLGLADLVIGEDPNGSRGLRATDNTICRHLKEAHTFHSPGSGPSGHCHEWSGLNRGQGLPRGYSV